MRPLLSTGKDLDQPGKNEAAATHISRDDRGARLAEPDSRNMCYVVPRVPLKALFASAALIAPLAAVAACSRGGKEAPTVAAAAANAAAGTQSAPRPSSAEAPKGTLVLGERITSGLVPLRTLASDARRYEDHVVATSGTVTAVCQEMGCWMEIRDESAHARVRMHGHSFFVPRSASGHFARVQAKIVPVKGGAEDCDEAANGEGARAKIELDATGVELD